MTKKQRLLKLRKKIIENIYTKRWEEVWFFPEYKEVKGVKGFLGTGPVMFIAINPAFGAYPSRPDIFYYRNLKKRGFGNAHLTDLFKIKTKNDSVEQLLENKKLFLEAKKYLAEEISIVKPKLIVPVGRSYKKGYDRVFEELGVKNLVYKTPIPHYAPRFNNAEKKKRFRVALRKVEAEQGRFSVL